jgi:alpha-L-rhamnosidase
MASHTRFVKLLGYLTLAGLAARAENWNAKWIAAQPDGAVPELRMPIFRCAVRLDKPVTRAVIDISGLGQYELSVNGRKIGDAVLQPGWTNYRKTVYYNTYDVTAALRPGENAIGVMLGNGFFNVPRIPGRYTKFTGSFGQPKLIARLRVTYRGGGGAEIVTDANWKWHPGPIVVSHAYGGEDYDATLEQTGWDQSGFDDREWAPALEVAGPGGNLVAQINPEIRVMQVFHPVKTTEPRPGVKVYDFGQNFSGWPAITVRGTAGAALKMIPGELLDANGLVSQRSSGGPQWFSYTLKGSGEETWSPRFSYYGFRYVQVEPSGDGALVAIEGRFVHAAAPQIGEFSCSNDLFNRIHKLIDAAILSNMQNVLTDCPHREKLGWLEQDHLLGSAIMYNYGVGSLYRKIADDMAEAQTPEGLVPDIAPEYTVFDSGFRDSPEWGSAVVLSPWLAYKHFGDRETLAAHYDAMKRYVDYLGGKAVNGMIAYGLGDWYDIGPRRPGVSQLTSLGVTATAIYYQDLATLRAIARVLGNAADEEGFARRAEAARAAFNAQLFDAGTGVYDRGSQTAYAMPLALGLVPEERRAAVLDKLVRDIVAHGNHTTAGDIGFHYVIQALSEGGRSDVIYDMLSNPEPPSYAAQLARGATTLTEAWDADPASSQNHFMLGHAEEWFYRYLAGIDFDASRPPDERIVLRPTPVGDIDSAQAKYQTPLGAVSSSWRRSGGRLDYDVEIPANATAKLLLPGQPPRQVRSGRHRFKITMAPGAR